MLNVASYPYQQDVLWSLFVIYANDIQKKGSTSFLNFPLVKAVEFQTPQFQNNSCPTVDTEGYRHIRQKGPR